MVIVSMIQQEAAILKYASPSCPEKLNDSATDGEMETWGESVIWRMTPVVGWTDATERDQLAEGKCHLGNVIGPMPSSPPRPGHVLQRTSREAWVAKYMRSAKWWIAWP